MRKTLVLIALLATCFTVYAQWSGTNPITTTSNVGIGTTSPTTKLAVNGQIGVITNDFVSGSVGSSINLYTGNVTGDTYGGLQTSNTGGTNPANLILNQYGGFVGIGTTDPHGYKLAVNGDMIATSVRVMLYSDWPDYVFKPQYQLPSLLSVKTYIDKNQHLPDMPSEQEVIKDGLNLGEMDKLLTKKVEELTLYLIEKDNAIEALNKKQDEQEKLTRQLEKEITRLKKIIK